MVDFQMLGNKVKDPCLHRGEYKRVRCLITLKFRTVMEKEKNLINITENFQKTLLPF